MACRNINLVSYRVGSYLPNAHPQFKSCMLSIEPKSRSIHVYLSLTYPGIPEIADRNHL